MKRLLAIAGVSIAIACSGKTSPTPQPTPVTPPVPPVTPSSASIKDPASNVTSIPRGSIVGVGVSMAGGGAGDVIRLVLTTPTGETFSSDPLPLPPAVRHSYWLWNKPLPPTPGAWTVSFFVNGSLVRSEPMNAL